MPKHNLRRNLLPTSGQFAGLAAIVFAMSTLAAANVPNAFTAGDIISSSEMNANFDALDADIADLQDEITVTNQTVALHFNGGTMVTYIGEGGATLDNQPSNGTVRVNFDAGTFSGQPVCTASWARFSNQSLFIYPEALPAAAGSYAFEVHCQVINGDAAPRQCGGTTNSIAMTCVGPR